MREIAIGKVATFPDPGRRVVEVDGVAVGVFRHNGVFVAYENVCPHMGGPVCQGKIIARVEERVRDDKTSLGLSFSRTQSNIVCPWHGYEFDIASGRHQGNPRLRLRPVAIKVVDDDLVVALPEGTRERIARARSAAQRAEPAP
ncbi:MAG TPA: Rieske (2Fe-2S) protein [Hyphomicrobiaceae bacterium]|jgi:nitrite reductase/ring-hydroxylating ferredoxin subunit|nr:Rieske (2Fe-2S) protein [Hyphomicrobiaceae bacterium]